MFLIKAFFHMAKYQDKNLNILRTKRAFKVKQKVFFIIFKGLSAAKNCLRRECVSLKLNLLHNVPNNYYPINHSEHNFEGLNILKVIQERHFSQKPYLHNCELQIQHLAGVICKTSKQILCVLFWEKRKVRNDANIFTNLIRKSSNLFLVRLL